MEVPDLEYWLSPSCSIRIRWFTRWHERLLTAPNRRDRFIWYNKYLLLSLRDGTWNDVADDVCHGVLELPSFDCITIVARRALMHTQADSNLSPWAHKRVKPSIRIPVHVSSGSPGVEDAPKPSRIIYPVDSFPSGYTIKGLVGGLGDLYCELLVGHRVMAGVGMRGARSDVACERGFPSPRATYIAWAKFVQATGPHQSMQHEADYQAQLCDTTMGAWTGLREGVGAPQRSADSYIP